MACHSCDEKSRAERAASPLPSRLIVPIAVRPEVPPVFGRCHVCEDTREITLCKACRHWMCDDCYKRVDARLFAALRHLAAPRPNCCGPLEQESR